MTISIEKLQQVTRVVTHDNCADGTASAILVHDALPEARIEFVQYGTPEYKALTPEAGEGVGMFVDFSPPADKAQAFADAGWLILDHHRGAQDVVKTFSTNGVFADETLDPGVSGAVLAFRHVWNPLARSASSQNFVRLGDPVHSFANQLAILAGIRDTWQRDHAWWHDACAQAEVLHFFPNDYWMATSLDRIAKGWDDISKIGELLLQKNAKRVDEAIKNGYRFTSKKGTRVIVFEGVIETSDAAEKLGDSVDLAIGFRTVCEPEVFVQAFDIPQQPKYIFSTRSHTHFNCAAFAKRFGGGGHTKAAGFARAFTTSKDPASLHPFGENPFSFVETCVRLFEATL